LRTVLTNEALEMTLSRERLGKYLNETRQDLDAAISLYERNTRLAEAFYTPLQCVEICLRNQINAQLSNAYGDDWFRNNKPPFNNDSMRIIMDAVDELKKDGKGVSPGRVLAELKFAFWVGLMGPRYDSTIWREAIYKAFLAGGGRPRGAVHSRFNMIRRFRNRIAHHEPIFQKPLQQTHKEIIEAIGWMCRHTSAWASHHSRFDIVFAETR
jgi:hypothetical protein